jgi:hypothetical protein
VEYAGVRHAVPIVGCVDMKGRKLSKVTSAATGSKGDFTSTGLVALAQTNGKLSVV